MNNFIICTIFFSTLMLGCRSTYNTVKTQKNPEFNISANRDGSLLIAIKTNTTIDKNKGFINTNLSYIISNSGQKFTLIKEENKWSRENYANASYWTPSDTFWISKDGISKFKIKPGKWDVYIFYTKGKKDILYSDQITISNFLIPPGTPLN